MSSKRRKSLDKVFVLDTSVLIHDPNVIERLGDNEIVIPLRVLEELDKGKSGHDMLAQSCREVSRNLDYYREKAAKERKHLKSGIDTDSGGKIYVDYAKADWKEIPDELDRNNDNRILLVAIAWKKKRTSQNVVLLTKDINLRVKADSCGIKTEDYTHDHQINTLDQLYPGTVEIHLDVATAHLRHDIGRDGFIEADKLSHLVDLKDLPPNICCYLVDGDNYSMAVYSAIDGKFKYVRKPKQDDLKKRGSHANGPINNEQAMAYALLMDPNIKIVTLVGKAGTGKTLIALLAAANQLGDSAFGGDYDGKPSRILVWRPNVEIGKSLGYLPGTESEKFSPYCEPIFENMRLILGKPEKDSEKGIIDPVAEYVRGGILSIKPINYALGSTKHNSIIIVDEAQNLTPRQIAALITRCGENSKIILTGDPNQIYTPYLTPTSNGLTYVVERLKGQMMFAHITMIRSERSEVAELAAELL